jgi:hypothetical protein
MVHVVRDEFICNAGDAARTRMFAEILTAKSHVSMHHCATSTRTSWRPYSLALLSQVPLVHRVRVSASVVRHPTSISSQSESMDPGTVCVVETVLNSVRAKAMLQMRGGRGAVRGGRREHRRGKELWSNCCWTERTERLFLLRSLLGRATRLGLGELTLTRLVRFEQLEDTISAGSLTDMMQHRHRTCQIRISGSDEPDDDTVRPMKNCFPV